jgi:glycosyltransferase involved in cell wall biosynthesis
VKYFTPSVDTEIFYPEKNSNKDKLRIIFYATPSIPRNGFYLGIEALKIVKEYFKDKIEIISFGEKFTTVDHGLDDILKNLGNISKIEDVAELYRSSDLGLVFMFTPHTQYQILEYMASGCATVTNINEANEWLLKDHENAVITEPTASCTAENIIKLLEDDKLREKIIMNGLKTVKLSNWETELESLLDFIKNPREIE